MSFSDDSRQTRGKNGNLIFPSLPVHALELLDDPRLQGMYEAPKGFSPDSVGVMLKPAERVRSASHYLLIEKGYQAEPARSAQWVNDPQRYSVWNGRGLGFDHIVDRPRIEQPHIAPKRLFHLWPFDDFFVASPDMVELLEKACPGSIVTMPIDWVFSDGRALDGYVFLDVIELQDAYDYKRSLVKAWLQDGRKHLRLAHERALREDIPATANLFRDAFERRDVLVSRALAHDIAQLADRELSFKDVHTRQSVELAPQADERVLKARLKQDSVLVDVESLPLWRRTQFRVMPLLREGKFAEAESLLTDWLRALPETPYHVIADLQVTTSPQLCAQYFDDFCIRARREHEQREQDLKTVYCEMNGFAINPDQWFCSAFGFAFEGHDDGDDWMGDFGSWDDGYLVLTGLEVLQDVFKNRMKAGCQTPPEHHDALELSEALVIVKFQRFLQRSLPLMKELRCPLWACAHDYYQYVGKILPAAQSCS